MCWTKNIYRSGIESNYTFMKKNSKKTKVGLIEKHFAVIKQLNVFVFLICMLGVFPLYYKEQYYKIGDTKFEFFWNVSLGFIGITLMCSFIKIVLNRVVQKDSNKLEMLYKEKHFKNRKYSKNQENIVNKNREEAENIFGDFLDNLSAMDYLVFVYAICVLLSYGFSDFKEFALKGAPGWEMGLCSQMMFVAIYFILSRQKIFGDFFVLVKAINIKSNLSERNKSGFSILLSQRKMAVSIIVIHLISSALTFILGMLHRFDIDPLGMYEGLDIYQKIEFLSTIGQATWFSGYVCTVFAIGVIVFYCSNCKWIRIVTGIYTVMSFGILVTQNSDSAFIAIAGILLLLGYFSLSDKEKWYRFWQICCLMWGTFGGIGILQRIFGDRRIPLESLSIFFSQSVVTWLMFVISLVLMGFYRNNSVMNKPADDRKIMQMTKRIYQSMLVLMAAAVIIIFVFIYLNTKGYLLKWFGYQSNHPYLLFDYHWGSNRGSTWMVCWQAFVQMPLHQKLFGVGPDSLWAYFNSVPQIRDFLYSLWGSMRLTNAHNEYLNSLLCYGVVGATAWLAVLIGGICYFYHKGKENSFMIAFALCIMGYACHNLFCYQQVCATPILFIVLGIGESLTKSKNFNTI